jgi:hypothetical protein
MKRSSRPARTPSNLSESTNLRLDMYALAACAAGVGVLALAPSAEAKIVYTQTWVEIPPRQTLSLDLNHDGASDFKLSNMFYQSGGNTSQGTLKILPTNSDMVWTTSGNGGAAALRAGVRIGPKRKFKSGPEVMATQNVFCVSGNCRSVSGGPWVNVAHRYLGLKFLIKGKIHYGWARLDVTITSRGVYAALTGYAYETIANRPIVAGKTRGEAVDIKSVGRNIPAVSPELLPRPATLGVLAQGARGLDVWRNRKASDR